MTEGDTPYDDDTLAAEYVLGVLETDARAEVVMRIDRDPAFAQLVSSWQERLSDLNDKYAPEPPPDRIKAALDARLFPKERSHGIWSVFGGLVAAGLVVAALAFFFVASPSPEFGAELRADGSDYVIELEINGSELTVALVQGAIPDSQTLELWQIIGDAAPVSLGTIGGDAKPPQTPYAQGQIVAVSLEPLGGSPTGAPTGPVVALGTLREI